VLSPFPDHFNHCSFIEIFEGAELFHSETMPRILYKKFSIGDFFWALVMSFSIGVFDADRGPHNSTQMSDSDGPDESLLFPAGQGSVKPSRIFPLKHILSQYLWMLCLLSIVLVKRAVPRVCDSGPVRSAPVTKPWDDGTDPIIFGHLTDVHINSHDRSIVWKANLRSPTTQISRYRHW
jgi:hypothetical protein